MINYSTFFPFKVQITGLKCFKFDYFLQQKTPFFTAFINFKTYWIHDRSAGPGWRRPRSHRGMSFDFEHSPFLCCRQCAQVSIDSHNFGDLNVWTNF